jgi:hypothetical protein
MNRLYSFANLGGIECGLFRLRGVGLANCLFPWARCVVASERHELQRITSTWPQLCHRQWIRRDLDKRTYAGLIDERSAIHGGRKLRLLATQQRIEEQVFLSAPERFQDGIVWFSGIDRYFAPILNNHRAVRKSLMDATRPKHKVNLSSAPKRELFVHVRYGDAVDANTPEGRALKIHYHLRQPMSWFVHMVGEVRRHVGEVPVRVFSDAKNDELRPLLTLPNVTRLTYGSSIADLLALSSANVLVASGSTFSMWASYLGRMPVIWPLSQKRQNLHGSAWEYEVELDHEPLPETVASLLQQRFSAEREFASAEMMR